MEKPIIKTGTPASVFNEKTKEIRTPCTLVQRESGDMILQHLELSNYKDGKETITKVKIAPIARKKSKS